MTVAALPFGGTETGCFPANRGFSKTSQTLCNLLEDTLSAHTSIVLGERYRALTEAASEAMVPNWDGYGAWPVDRAALSEALAFLRALPTSILEPEIGIEPDGHVALDWHRGPRRTFTITIRGDGELNYATLLGRDKTYGTASFVEEVPQQVAYLLAWFLARRGPEQPLSGSD